MQTLEIEIKDENRPLDLSEIPSQNQDLADHRAQLNVRTDDLFKIWACGVLNFSTDLRIEVAGAIIMAPMNDRHIRQSMVLWALKELRIPEQPKLDE